MHTGIIYRVVNYTCILYCTVCIHYVHTGCTRYMYSGPPCIFWTTMYILDHHVYSGPLCILYLCLLTTFRLFIHSRYMFYFMYYILDHPIYYTRIQSMAYMYTGIIYSSQFSLFVISINIK